MEWGGAQVGRVMLAVGIAKAVLDIILTIGFLSQREKALAALFLGYAIADLAALAMM
jgi:hypothetical protein